MNKYIDAEKLIAEIDRQEIGCNTDGKHTAEYNTCRKILDIIISLQQEQPEITSIKGYLSRDTCGQLIISLSPNYMDDEWMLLESKLFPEIKSESAPHCVNIIIKEIK